MSQLSGKFALVTGGGSGIGLAIARRFMREGAYVFIVGRRQRALDDAVAMIGENVAAAMIPLGRLGGPEEVAAAALFLASEESSFIAGVELCIDGGLAQV
jgi:NAD(P)-dependent dehydrogenase (short-subunit alcohol dehydrogenase family)